MQPSGIGVPSGAKQPRVLCMRSAPQFAPSANKCRFFMRYACGLRDRCPHQLLPLGQEPLKVVGPKPRLVPMGNQVAGEHGFHREARLISKFRHVDGGGARLMRWLVWLSIRQMVARQRERSLGLTSRSCSGLKRKPRTFSGAGTADLICSRWAPTSTLLLARGDLSNDGGCQPLLPFRWKSHPAQSPLSMPGSCQANGSPRPRAFQAVVQRLAGSEPARGDWGDPD